MPPVPRFRWRAAERRPRRPPGSTIRGWRDPGRVPDLHEARSEGLSLRRTQLGEVALLPDDRTVDEPDLRYHSAADGHKATTGAIALCVHGDRDMTDLPETEADLEFVVGHVHGEVLERDGRLEAGRQPRNAGLRRSEL